MNPTKRSWWVLRSRPAIAQHHRYWKAAHLNLIALIATQESDAASSVANKESYVTVVRIVASAQHYHAAISWGVEFHSPIQPRSSCRRPGPCYPRLLHTPI